MPGVDRGSTYINRRPGVVKEDCMTWWDNKWNDPPGENGSAGNSGGGENRNRGPRIFRLRLTTGMKMGRDILYLDDNIFRFWEHNGKDENGRWNCFGVCRAKNRIGDGECAVCDEDRRYYEAKKAGTKPNPFKPINLYNIGFTTAIDISFAVGKEYRGNRNMYLMEKRIVPLKRGGEKYPGALADIARIREREGRLRGIVVHQIRRGEKSPQAGDSFEVVDRIEPTDEAIMEYLKQRVRRMLTPPAQGQLGLIQSICQQENVAPPTKEWYIEKMQKLDLSPAPYEQMFEPMSNVDLANHFGVRAPEGKQQDMGMGGGEDPGLPEDSFNYGDDPFAGAGEGPPPASSDSDEDMPF